MIPVKFYIGNPMEETTHKDVFCDNYIRGVYIECRGLPSESFEGKVWAVTYMGEVISKTGVRSHERQPSSRTDHFLKTYRHTKHDAVPIAMRFIKAESKRLQKEFDIRFTPKGDTDE